LDLSGGLDARGADRRHKPVGSQSPWTDPEEGAGALFTKSKSVRKSGQRFEKIPARADLSRTDTSQRKIQHILARLRMATDLLEKVFSCKPEARISWLLW
jgi:hypothetical protein